MSNSLIIQAWRLARCNYRAFFLPFLVLLVSGYILANYQFIDSIVREIIIIWIGYVAVTLVTKENTVGITHVFRRFAVLALGLYLLLVVIIVPALLSGPLFINLPWSIHFIIFVSLVIALTFMKLFTPLLIVDKRLSLGDAIKRNYYLIKNNFFWCIKHMIMLCFPPILYVVIILAYGYMAIEIGSWLFTDAVFDMLGISKIDVNASIVTYFQTMNINAYVVTALVAVPNILAFGIATYLVLAWAACYWGLMYVNINKKMDRQLSEDLST